ncbi:ABC transporter F family member 4 [Haematococcus lacustris]|uniref:ABC transporter F family member 4 n=1 Tax=Haematococcus lacustris TaxID=44745 RepID=A0A699ZXJ6_HAELA|nr:ABC transporter F family member 4 [Haematococcus lacustris]
MDMASMHTGCPVLKGIKWAAPVWIHTDQFNSADWEYLQRAKPNRVEYPAEPGQCDDAHPQCKQWAAAGECAKNHGYMVNKAYDKFEKQLKAAKTSTSNAKQKADKVRETAAKTAAKKNRAAAVDDAGASTANTNQPQKWSDYTVEFHFPEPSELPPPLIQMIDVDFKYPGR